MYYISFQLHLERMDLDMHDLSRTIIQPSATSTPGMLKISHLTYIILIVSLLRDLSRIHLYEFKEAEFLLTYSLHEHSLLLLWRLMKKSLLRYLRIF